MTLRELSWMAEGRRRDEWQRTGSIMLQVAELYRDRKKHPNPYELSDFSPFEGQGGRKPARRGKGGKLPLKALKGVIQAIWCKKGKR